MNRQAGTVFAVLDGSIDPQLVQSSLPAGSALLVSQFTEGAESLMSALDKASPDLVLIGCGDDSEAGAIDLIKRTRTGRPDGALVVIRTGSVNGFMDQAFRAGADDLITLPQPSESIAFVFEKAMSRRRGGTPSTSLGSMICIVGPKGGTGKTLTACNLAVALALAGKRAVIVDVDLQFGDVGIALGISPERTLYDLALSGGSQDADKLDQFLVPHSSGARALLAPTRPDQAGAIHVNFLRDVYAGLRAGNDFVIVDTPPAFSPEVIASIDGATDLCVVGMLDALSLKDTKIGIETLALMGYDSADLKLVLNRADSSVGISHGDVEAILGRRPDICVPSDRAIPRAITDGQPIVLAEPGSGAAQAFRDLAALFINDRAARSEGGGAELDRAVAPSGRRKLFRKAR
jgi:pilus assembly protein CpaE